MKKVLRARSLKTKFPFYKAIVWTVLFYLGLVSSVTSLATIYFAHSQVSKALFIASVLVTAFFWIGSLLARKAATCSLCRSTPYHQTGAIPHVRATKLPILNYGHSNVIRSLCTNKFRCQHCGELYDLLKPSETQRRKEHDAKLTIHPCKHGSNSLGSAASNSV